MMVNATDVSADTEEEVTRQRGFHERPERLTATTSSHKWIEMP